MMIGLSLFSETLNILSEKDEDPNADKDTDTTSPDDTDNTQTDDDTKASDDESNTDDTTDDPTNDDDMSMDDTGDNPNTDPSTDDPSAGDTGDGTDPSMDGTTDPSSDNVNKNKKKLLIQNYTKLYNDISFAIKSFREIGVESDEEKETLSKSVENLLNIREAMWVYINGSFDSDDYGTCLYKFYYFKDVLIVADEIIQKIKEFRKES